MPGTLGVGPSGTWKRACPSEPLIAVAAGSTIMSAPSASARNTRALTW
jgi:hypothetical protein